MKKPTWIGTGGVLPKNKRDFLLDFVLVLSNKNKVIRHLKIYRCAKTITIDYIPIGITKKTIEEPRSKLRGMFCLTAEPTGNALVFSVQRMEESAKFEVIPFVTYDARYGNSAPKTICKDISRGD